MRAQIRRHPWLGAILVLVVGLLVFYAVNVGIDPWSGGESGSRP